MTLSNNQVPTQTNGSYKFSNLASGTYTVTPSKQGYGFNPPSRKVTLKKSNVTGVNFKEK